MADVFSDNGYAAGMVGKWHNGLHDMRYHPNDRGFPEFAGFLNGGMDYYQWVLDRNGRAEKCDGRYLTDVFTEESINFIRRHRKEPFFLYLCYNAPHPPYQAPEKSIERFKGIHALTDEVRTIYAMIEVMDSGIGRILETVRQLRLEENTIVIFTSDNGPLLTGNNARYNGPFRGGKGDVLEGGIRVPAMLKWPDHLPQGEERHKLFHFCDWLPSLTAMTGGVNNSPKPLDGTDRSSYLQDGISYDPKPRFWQRNRYEPVTRCNGAVRDGNWKLVWPMREGADRKMPEDGKMYFDGLTSPHRVMDIRTGLPERSVAEQQNTPELYRIDLDPGESRDLSAENPDRTESMKQAWDEWFSSIKEEWLSSYCLNIGT
jgi:arylsulfatase A